MTELQILLKDRKKTVIKIQRIKTYICLIASHHLYTAVIMAECSKPSTFKEAKFTSDMVNLFFKKDSNPYEFMKPVEETANESIDEYKIYQDAVSQCQFDKRILESFAHWYAYSGFSVAMLRCNMGYIMQFGLSILERNNGKITEAEMIDSFACIIRAGKDLFTFYPGLVMRTFIETVKKFEEIEQKVELRKASNNCSK